MVRRPTRAGRPRRPLRTREIEDEAPRPTRQRIIDTFMDLLAEKSFGEIGFNEIAETAGVSLAELRTEFTTTLGILAAHIKETDRRVLADVDPAMEQEPPRERLFDVLMHRLELLEPYREAVRSLLHSATRNPGLALALNNLTVLSQQWMLAAAGIGSAGPKGLLRAQGLALLYANVLRTWVDDEDPGLARTLAALDRELARGQRLGGLLDGLFRVPEAACRVVGGRRRRPPRRGRYEGETIPA
jgi:AcrR family transcriptional regulator